MTEPYVGQIQLFGFNFAPRSWAICQGQFLAISQNTALFSIIGTFYGGNGTSNFQLPDFQGNAAIGAGQGIGLSPYSVGQYGGESSVSIILGELPSHNHSLNAASSAGTTATIAGNQLAYSQIGGGKGGGQTQTAAIYSPNPSQATTALATQSISAAGGNQPHNNMQPFLALNYCICLAGVFPPRN